MAKLLSGMVLGLVLVALTALALSLAATTPAGAAGNPNHDSAVGGGQVRDDLPGSCHITFSLSTRVNDDTPATPPQPTVNGHVNVSIEPNGACGVSGHVVARVDCLEVTGNTADMTGVVTQSTGAFATAAPEGSEVSMPVLDSGSPGGAGDAFDLFSSSGPCDFTGSPDIQIDHGNISVNDA